MKEEHAGILIVLVTVALWVLNAGYIGDIMERRPFFKVNEGEKRTDSTKEFALVSQALASRKKADTFKYVGGFSTPFRALNPKKDADLQQSPDILRAPKPEPVREKLTLGGILWKERALAIIEDSRGSTFILSAGDTVHGQKIMTIKDNRVTLKDTIGTYDLTLRE